MPTNMMSQEIQGDSYSVQYEAESTTITFQGKLALPGSRDYSPINALLQEIASKSPEVMTLDLKQLSFLNSSGISMLSKFVLGLRKRKGVQLVVWGSSDMPWQSKSLRNLQKFLPSLQLEIE